jgi:hypothetical protein
MSGRAGNGHGTRLHTKEMALPILGADLVVASSMSEMQLI